MKKLSAPVLALAVLISFTASSFAQPRLVITLKGGYSQPLGGLHGNPADLFPQTTSGITSMDYRLYQKIGFNLGADLKLAFDNKRYIRGVLGLGYANFSNSYGIPPNTAGGYGSNETYEPQFYFFTTSLGIECAIQPAKKIVPFFGAGFAGFFYGGKAWKLDPPKPPFPTETKWKTGSRFGIYGNVGVDFKITREIAVNIGVKFNYINLIGKSDDTTGIRSSTEIPLVDEEHKGPVPWGTNVQFGSAELMSIDFSAGISFFLLQPKVKNKIYQKK